MENASEVSSTLCKQGCTHTHTSTHLLLKEWLEGVTVRPDSAPLACMAMAFTPMLVADLMLLLSMKECGKCAHKGAGFITA